MRRGRRKKDQSPHTELEEAKIEIERLEPKTLAEARQAIDYYIHFYNYKRIQLEIEWRRCRCATPLKIQYFPTEDSFCTVHQSEAIRN